MKKISLFVGALLTVFAVKAQQFATYYDGRPAMELKYADVEGEELLYANWMPGQIKTKEGKIFTDQKLKYNQLLDQFFFQNGDGTSMAFVTPVSEVELGDPGFLTRRTFRNGYPAVMKFTPENYFEVLVDGKQQLLKKTTKQMVETKDYNSPTIKRHIQDEVHYFLYTGSKMVAVKKDKSAVLEAMPEKAAAIEAYFSSAKPNLKKEDDLVKLVRHLNTL